MSGPLTEQHGTDGSDTRITSISSESVEHPSELRVPLNPHTFVRLQIAAWAFLALAIYCGRELLS